MNTKKKFLPLLLLLFLIVVIFYIVTKFNAPATERAEMAVDTPAANEDTGEISLNEALQMNTGNEISFAHVVPGEYSEVYLLLRGGQPGQQKLVTLDGPGMVSDGDQSAVFDDKGEARYTWRINRYGTYVVHEDMYDPVTEQDVPMEITQVTVN